MKNIWKFVYVECMELCKLFKIVYIKYTELCAYFENLGQNGCERPWKLPLKKERFLDCFLGHLSFWVSGMEWPLIFLYKK